MRGAALTDIAQSLPLTVPFTGPEAQERARGRKFIARIGANENVFGPSPKAIAAMERAASDIWKYGDPENHDLIQALARHHGIQSGNVVIGEGIDGLLNYVTHLYVGPGDNVVTSAGAYPTFNYYTAGRGGQLHTVPFSGNHEDLDALVDKAHEVGAKLVYFVNPDNPMGSWLDAETINQAIARLPDGCTLIMDEAYVEFAPQSAVPALDISDAAVIRMRTFSKAYGMAGARVGYAIGEAGVIKSFEKIRNHFGVNLVAQAGALAALGDQDYLNEIIGKVAAAREKIAAIATENGLEALPSATNFVTIDCGHDGDFARDILGELLSRDVFVRMPFTAPQDRCIRISAGTQDDLAAFANALPEALAIARSRL